jgi:hypothetical protein
MRVRITKRNAIKSELIVFSPRPLHPHTLAASRRDAEGEKRKKEEAKRKAKKKDFLLFHQIFFLLFLLWLNFFFSTRRAMALRRINKVRGPFSRVAEAGMRKNREIRKRKKKFARFSLFFFRFEKEIIFFFSLRS